MRSQSLVAVVMIAGALTALVVGPYFTMLQTVAACIGAAGIGFMLVNIFYELRSITQRMDANGPE